MSPRVSAAAREWYQRTSTSATCHVTWPLLGRLASCSAAVSASVVMEAVELETVAVVVVVVVWGPGAALGAPFGSASLRGVFGWPQKKVCSSACTPGQRAVRDMVHVFHGMMLLLAYSCLQAPSRA